MNTLHPIVNFEEYYSITKNGSIYSHKTDKWLKQSDSNGYLVVNLRMNNKHNLKYVHRLVAINFINNPENKPQVNHKDLNKHNNSVDNLEWMTAKENLQHSRTTQKYRKYVKMKDAINLSDLQIKKYKKLVNAGVKPSRAIYSITSNTLEN